MAYDPLDFVQRGKAAIVRRQFGEAVKICRLGLLAHPTLLAGRVVLATALTALGRWDEVLAEMRAALELAPDSADAWLLKGEALIQKSDFRQAQQALERAKQLDPSNPRCEQLLAEIELARAAGFEGTPAEPTETKVYPAARLASVASAAVNLGEETEEESTQVDANPTGALLLGAAPAVMMPIPKASSGPWLDVLSDDDAPDVALAPDRRGTFSFDESEDLADSEDVATDTFDRPLPPAPSSPMSEAFDIATPLEVKRGLATSDEPTEIRSDTGSIELSSADLFGADPEAAPRLKPLEPLDLADPAGDESTEVNDHGDDEATRERRPFVPAPARQTTPAPRNPIAPRPTPVHSPAKPVGRARQPTRKVAVAARKVGVSLPAPQLALVGGALLVVVGLGVVFGLFVRQWRAKARIANRYQLAAADTLRGDYQGLRSAARLYRQILDEKDEPAAHGLEARVLAQLAYEFGDAPERALQAAATIPPQASEAAEEAKILLALLSGGVDAAELRSDALWRQRQDATTSYLAGRVHLARDHAERAAQLFRQALSRSPRDVPALFALGVAEAELGHGARALEVWNRALELTPTHAGVRAARAALIWQQGSPQDSAVAQEVLRALAASATVDELAPAERARVELALAELAVRNGDVLGARKALAVARASRTARDTTLAEALAVGYLGAVQLDEADEEARRALAGAGAARLAPRLVLAELALLRERPADALAALDGAPPGAAVAVLQARAVLLQHGVTDGARRNLLAALQQNPNSVAVRVALARCDLADGHAERALRDLERLWKLAPRADVEAALGAAFATRPREHETALRWLTQAARRQPLAVDVRLDLVRLLRAEGKLPEARAELEAVLAIAPKLGPARRLQARVALEAGDAKLARGLYDDVAATTPDPDALLGGAEAALAEGDAAGADLRVNQALALRPTLGEVASVMRARALILEHRQEEAVSLLGAVVRNAQSGETPALLMLAYLERGDAGRAFQVPILAPARVRQSPEVLAARARLHLERGHDIAAESVAREALAAMDKKPTAAWIQSEALVVLGRSLWDQGTFKPALKILRRAVELTPKSARAQHSLGLVLDEMRRDTEARAAFEAAVGLDSRLAEADFFLGRVRTRLGDDRAAQAFRAYLDLQPRGVYAAEAHAALGEGKLPAQAKQRPKAKPTLRPSSSPLRSRRREP